MEGKITDRELNRDLYELLKRNYLWTEEKIIYSGNNYFSLSNTVDDGDQLKIIDKKYYATWIEGEHWTREGQRITLTEPSIQEDLTFEVTNLG